MVDKLENLLQHLEAVKGGVSLFAIFKMDEYIDKWTILVGASWINGETAKETFEIMRTFILTNFDQEQLSTIARVAVYSDREHIIQELLKYKSGTNINELTKINGNIIHKGIIIKSVGLPSSSPSPSPEY